MAWEVVIGLEIHTQLATQSKIFSTAPTAYGAEPNTQASLVDLAMPGVLPVLNEKVMELATKFGLAIGAEIGLTSVFDRKNYFYPDSPKAYQITQMDFPIVIGGQIDIDLEDGTTKRINVTRAHLEEDAGKSLHGEFTGQTGIDLNRAGTPLIEIVSEPEMRSAKEAVAYMRKMHALVRYIGISDGNMQEGSFRCDANVSIRPFGQEELGTRAEIKHLNSFKFIEQAINYEVERQAYILESGGRVIQETRLYDPDKGETRSMRSKEEANDYRYFPDPDLLPVVISQAFVDNIAKNMPELPDQKKQRFIDELGLSTLDAGILTSNRELSEYFEQVANVSKQTKLAANWVTGNLSAKLNKENIEIDAAPVTAEMLATVIQRISDKTISGKIAKDVFEAMWNGEGSCDEVIEKKGLKQITDNSAIEAMIDEVIANNPNQLAQYQAGKQQLLGFFVGQVMKASRGKANPAQVNQLLRTKLQG
jgi:aspartyl-tRNA(Asn)/glutamyl-tRNA(Gln) amidotransferase subunit B